ncbi:MAG: hypothetical protein ACYC35_29485 [Pirellulales bacterium]
MNHLRSLVQRVLTLLVGLECWLSLQALAWAKAAPAEPPAAAGAGDKTYVLPYMLVLLALCLGMLVVCRSARRSDKVRVKDELD